MSKKNFLKNSINTNKIAIIVQRLCGVGTLNLKFKSCGSINHFKKARSFLNTFKIFKII